jgi:dUTP pyrophosphatase
MNIKKLRPDAVIPFKGSDKSAGYDLSSLEDYTLQSGEYHLFKTGLSMAIPSGKYGRIAPRSGLALKSGIDVMAGVIDEDYRGELGVILINLGKEPKSFKKGDKIAQIIFENYNNVAFSEVDNLDSTERGGGGWGHSDENNLTSTGPTMSIADMYKNSGGVPVKEKYTEEIKKRENNQ